MKEIKIEPIKCIDGSTHDFEILHDIKKQVYYHENGQERDNYFNQKDYLVCKKCGIDSRIINNPIIVVNEENRSVAE